MMLVLLDVSVAQLTIVCAAASNGPAAAPLRQESAGSISTTKSTAKG